MNLGLIRKTLRETWPVTLACGLGLLVFEAILAYIYPTFHEEFSDILLSIKLLNDMMRALLGTDFTGQFGPDTINAIAWVHPLMLTLAGAHCITLCTKLPAGEVDRGTIDVLLGLPVSRWLIYLCESVVWLVAGLIIVLMSLIGNWLGGLPTESSFRPDPYRLFVILCNLYCLYLAVGGLSCLLSSISDRRGKAIAIAFGIVLTSYLLNFLVQFWEPARSISFLSLMDYYKPLLIIRDTGWPVTDMVVLLLVAGLLWLAGGLIFARRDICTA